MTQNILMLTPYLPYPPVSGGRSRTFNLVKRLARDYKITLLCFGRPEEKAFDIKPLQDLCEVVVIDRPSSPGTLRAAMLSLTSVKPITMRLYASAEFREAIRKLMRVRLYDLIHIESFYMLQNLPRDLPIPVLLAEPAIEYLVWWRHAKVARPLYQRPAIALEALKMRIFEPQAWADATLVAAMSENDSQAIQRAIPGLATAISPNGVDVDYFKPGDALRAAENAVFMGDYKYFPNADAVHYFVREVMPLIREHSPKFTLTVLGKDPTPEIVALGNDPNSGVKVAGLVDDTRPYLHQATMFVCPLRSGSGTRFKLLESLACGCPVVSTTLGAEGLGAVDGRHLLLADTPRAFADSVLRIINQPEEALRLGRLGRGWVVERHSWAKNAALLNEIYINMIGSEDMTVMSSVSRRARRR